MCLAAPPGLVCCVAFSPDGQKLAAAGFEDQSVHVSDAASGRACFGPLAAFPGRVTGLAFSPDGKRLAATGYDNIVKLWDAATGGDVLTLRGLGAPGSGHYAFTGRVVFSPDGTRIAANTWDGSINVWDAGGKP